MAARTTQRSARLNEVHGDKATCLARCRSQPKSPGKQLTYSLPLRICRNQAAGFSGRFLSVRVLENRFILRGRKYAMSKVSRREILYSGALVAAGSLLLKPAFAHSDLLATAVEKAEGAGVIEGIPEIDLAPREHLLFDFDWRFLHGHATH